MARWRVLLAPLVCWTSAAVARSADVPPAPSPLPVLLMAEAASRLPSNAIRQVVGHDVYAEAPRTTNGAPAPVEEWTIRDHLGCIGVTNAFGRWRFPVDGTIEIVRLPRSMRLRPPAGGAGWELTARGPLVVETKRATERGTVSVRIFRNTPCFEIRLDPAGPGDGIRVEFPAAAAGERSRLLTDRGAMDESVLQAVVDSAEGWAVVEGDGFSLAAWPLAENQALHLRRDGTTAWLLSGGSPLGFALVGPDGESVVKWRRESWTSRARTAR